MLNIIKVYEDNKLKLGQNITRASFINSGIREMPGGVDEDYPCFRSR